jgi:short-subunit dehydrogenase
MKGSVVFITGASSGIGRAIALDAARRGASVVVAARRLDRLTELAKEIEAAGAGALAVLCDVTSEQSLAEAVEAALRRFGRLDIVFANAGFGVVGKFERLTIADFERQFATNVFGVLKTAKAALPALRQTRGSLVITGSVMGYLSLPEGAPYPMSKFAVRALAESLYHELKNDGVHVMHVAPGFVASEIQQVDNQGRFDAERSSHAPKWLEMPADVAARKILNAVERRRREVVITFHGKALVFLTTKLRFVLHGLIGLVGSGRAPVNTRGYESPR